MAAFDDALDLRTAVVEAVGDASIADVWPRLVSLAEARLNRALRTRWQIGEAVLSVVAGVADMPDDYAEAIELRSGTNVVWTGATGVTIGQVLSGVTGPLALAYYAKLQTLSDSLTATNWLLEQYPDAYLYACAAEAAKHLRDVEGAATFGTLRDEVLADVRADDYAARYATARVHLKVAP